MSIFIDPNATVPVTHEDYPDDTIYIKSRISFETYARIEESLMKLEIRASSKGNGKVNKDDDDVMIGARYTKSGQEIALLLECVDDWDGPMFMDERNRKVPCTRRNIAMLDPHHPLVARVLSVIDDRNQPTTDLPKSKAKSPNPSESDT